MTWRLGVVGYPIEHSLTPQLHDAALAHLGLEGTSQRVAMKDPDAGALRALMGDHYDALSVTMPLKETAAEVCDDYDDVARRTGVVNSLLWREGRVHGACTDGPGFLDALLANLGAVCQGMNVVVHGAGGAARGIVDALVHANAACVVVMGRTAANVERLTSAYDRVVDATHELGHVDLVVNTQPVFSPALGAFELPGVDASTVAIDITYEPRMSPWRQTYADMGCRSANGLAMLAYQAARQMQWWFQRDVDGAQLLAVIE